ncbi:unnamed protein product [Rangifer tarandus platyrhynchus]|uniref:Uncharacterized protein n=2 Tax=Rangifer tarandus platyrhynchus TaxID=3082113 RepID=A0ACB0EQZ8_RANTA|nr:unnamed protein product [Rangifer tarandus platyrhynchus]CAI9702471.1 unnamed protein product [Rangifer tarandus platyrhynchus]
MSVLVLGAEIRGVPELAPLGPKNQIFLFLTACGHSLGSLKPVTAAVVFIAESTEGSREPGQEGSLVSDLGSLGRGTPVSCLELAKSPLRTEARRSGPTRRQPPAPASDPGRLGARPRSPKEAPPPRRKVLVPSGRRGRLADPGRPAPRAPRPARREPTPPLFAAGRARRQTPA